MSTYKQALPYLLPKLIVPGLLSFIIIGIPFLIATILEFFTTEVTLDERSVTLKKGILSVHKTEVLYSKINSITIHQDLFGKIFKYGDVIIMAGNDVSGIPLKGIDHPENLKKEVYSKIQS